MTQKSETPLSRIRKKINTKAAAVLLSGATVVCGGIGVKKYNKHKAEQQAQQQIENYQSMKEGFQAIYSKADTFIFDDEKGIYMAVYTIPEDLQKDLAVEYNYMTQTRANVEKRLKALNEVDKNASRLADLGYNTGINVKDKKEYKVLSEVINKIPSVPEIVPVLAKYGNAINKIDFDGDTPNFNSNKVHGFGVTSEVESSMAMNLAINGFSADEHWPTLHFMKLTEINGESATILAQNQVKLMRETMQSVEEKLQEAGLGKYLGEKNENIEVTQRKVDLYEEVAYTSERQNRSHFRGSGR